MIMRLSQVKNWGESVLAPEAARAHQMYTFSDCLGGPRLESVPFIEM